MNRFIYTILFCFFVQLCCAQDNTQANSITVDSVSQTYVLAPHDSVVYLQDSAQRSLHGNVYLQLLVDDNSTIYAATILQIELLDRSNKVILKYSFDDNRMIGSMGNYPNFFEAYCEKNLKVQKIGMPRKRNVLAVRFIIE
jgi:hypothetical protein